MAIGVRVTTNMADLQQWLTSARSRQIPFATALALTNLAKAGRSDVLEGLGHRFVLRSRKFPNAFRYKPADKRAWPRIESIVYSLAEASVLQEGGGTKKPRGRSLAIPGQAVRPTPATRIPPSKRPHALLAKPGYFLSQPSGQSGGLPWAILKRVGKGRYPLRVAYLFTPRAKITARLGMEPTVRAKVESGYAAAFEAALEQAFKTAILTALDRRAATG